MRLQSAGILTLGCILLGAAGCRKAASPARGTSASTGAAAPAHLTAIDWKTAGTIEGTIRYQGTPPKPATLDMSQDPVCSMSSGSKQTEQYVVHHGGLANVFVWIKSGLEGKQYPVPSQPVVVDQKGCRYIPHVVAAMAGQPVRFDNSDATMHNVHIVPTVAGNPAVNLSEPPNGSAQPRIFPRPEQMLPVRCNDHPWMEAFLNIAANPFFAVSGKDGHFTIRGVPPGTYTLGADHEKLGTQTQQITVKTGQITHVDFTYSGTATR
jgi:plastocyanin